MIHKLYHSQWNGIILVFTTNRFVSHQDKSEKIFVAKVAYRIATNGSIVMRWISTEREQLNLSKDCLDAEFDAFGADLYLN